MVPDGNVQSANSVAREAIPHLRGLGARFPRARFEARIVVFDDDARWQESGPVELAAWRWEPVDGQTGGLSEFGVALDLVHRHFAGENRSADDPAPPILVAVTDGWWTDTAAPSASEAIARLDADPIAASWGRTVFPVSREPEISGLRKFAGNGQVLDVATPQALGSFAERFWGFDGS